MKKLFLLATLIGCQVHAAEVLTSIKPLQLITDAISHDLSAEVLLKSGASPHDYALKPSDVKKIQDAKLVIWIGPQLEGSLNAILKDKNNALALLPLVKADQKHSSVHQDEDTDTPHQEHPHQHEDKVHIEDEEADHNHDHDHSVDPHIWLDPKNGLAIAKIITEKLSEVDPKKEEIYQKNLNVFEKKLHQVDADIKQQLKPLKNKGYFVFHDAYGYWEDHYEIPATGYFTINPVNSPGAKTVQKIHQALKNNQAKCIFAEPQFKPAIIDTVIKGTDAKSSVLDPLGSEIKRSPEGYFDFLQSLADAMTECLED